MFRWQFVILSVLLLTTICILGSVTGDDSKTCFQFTGSPIANAKCSAFCIEKGKKGGSCIKKRCVCNDNEDADEDEDEDEGNENKSEKIVTMRPWFKD